MPETTQSETIKVIEENEKLKHDLAFTKNLLNEMSEKAQQAEDLKNLAEYKLKKAEENNKEIASTIDSYIQNLTETRKKAENTLNLLSTINTENSTLKKINEKLSYQIDTAVQKELSDSLHIIWLQTALDCLKDQISQSESKSRCITTILTSETYNLIKNDMIYQMNEERRKKGSQFTIDDMHTILMRYFAKEWEKIYMQFQ